MEEPRDFKSVAGLCSLVDLQKNLSGIEYRQIASNGYDC